MNLPCGSSISRDDFVQRTQRKRQKCQFPGLWATCGGARDPHHHLGPSPPAFFLRAQRLYLRNAGRANG